MITLIVNIDGEEIERDFEEVKDAIEYLKEVDAAFSVNREFAHKILNF